MISWPRLGTITHITSSPEWKIDIATAWTGPIIFPAAAYKPPIAQHNLNLNLNIVTKRKPNTQKPALILPIHAYVI